MVSLEMACTWFTKIFRFQLYNAMPIIFTLLIYIPPSCQVLQPQRRRQQRPGPNGHEKVHWTTTIRWLGSEWNKRYNHTKWFRFHSIDRCKILQNHCLSEPKQMITAGTKWYQVMIVKGVWSLFTSLGSSLSHCVWETRGGD